MTTADDFNPEFRPPAIGFVVHEVLNPVNANDRLWAWCQVTENLPGYSEITLTRNDGTTSVDPDKVNGRIQLGPALFQVWA